MRGSGAWPETAEELERVQAQLAEAAGRAIAWRWPELGSALVAGAFVAYRRGVYGMGAPGDQAWAAAAIYKDAVRVAAVTLTGGVGAPYLPGLLALREGPILEAVVRKLTPPPEVVLFDSTGLDHPRGAGLALHLGAALDVPTVGVTDRPLLATGGTPGPKRGDRAELEIEGRVVGFALRTQDNVKPVLVHAAWRTDPETACEVVLATSRVRTPEPLREARRVAKELRARAE
jgi:deoxyribonuclease V